MTVDELKGSGVLDFNVYATLQTSASDLQHDPAFDADTHPPVLDGPPPDYPGPADCRSATDDGPSLTEVYEAGSADPDPAWENFSDLEFPRDALDLIDTLGSSSFGEVQSVTISALQSK